jgi:hypothetical protein
MIILWSYKTEFKKGIEKYLSSKYIFIIFDDTILKYLTIRECSAANTAFLFYKKTYTNDV